MRVTFTCEKCGKVTDSMTHQSEQTFKAWVDGINGKFAPWDCPNCAKLTYGPLTEEIVAEALFATINQDSVAWGDFCDSDARDEYLSQARFVLRLLNMVAEGWSGSKAELTQYWGDARDWLLDLARKP